MNQSMWADPAPAPAPEAVPEKKPSPPAPAHTSLIAPAPDPAPDLPDVSDLSAPPPDESSAESFAQTGAQMEDLFDDAVPVEEESMRIRSDDDLFSDDFTPTLRPEVEQFKPEPVREPVENSRARGGGRERGRGRGNVQNRNGAPREAKGSDDPPKATTNPPKQSSEPSKSEAPENAPTGPRKETTSSVRGDRRATGGVRKPKLTEEELAEKLAEIQIKNASLTAAHARAEADAASFEQREQQAKQLSAKRQKEERRDRQQMMGEREKNRQRKLKAMEGREWDAEKKEEDFGRGGRFDKTGGFGGDKEGYTDGREYLYREPKQERSRGGGGGRGRGGRSEGSAAAAPRQEDFPALLSPTTKTGNASVSKQTQDSFVSSDATKAAGKSWADQVEAAPSV